MPLFVFDIGVDRYGQQQAVVEATDPDSALLLLEEARRSAAEAAAGQVQARGLADCEGTNGYMHIFHGPHNGPPRLVMQASGQVVFTYGADG